MPPYRKMGAYCFNVVRLSICPSINLSVCLHKLNMRWVSNRYTSPGAKVICKGQGQISGSCFSKDGCFRGISVSQTHLVMLDF